MVDWNPKIESIGIVAALQVFRFSILLSATVPFVIVFGTGITDRFMLSGVISALSLISVSGAFLYATGRSRSYLDIDSINMREVGLSVGGGLMLIAVQILLSRAYSAGGIEAASVQYPIVSAQDFLVFGTVLVLVIPPAEEIFYRNVLQKHLYTTLSAKSSILIASLIFASSHILNYLGHSLSSILASLSIVFLAGCLIGYIYYQSENIYIPIIIHAINNLATLVVPKIS